VSAGPLLVFDTRTWPDWLTLWEDDFDSLRECRRAVFAGRRRTLLRQGRFLASRRPHEHGRIAFARPKKKNSG